MEELMGLLAMSGMFNFTSFAFSVAMYVLGAVGLYTIANRRGITNPWLAWIPVGNMWILGNLSDQYQLSVKRKKTNRRKILLIVSIIPAIIAFVLVILIMIMVVQLVANPDYIYIPQLENPYGAQYSHNVSAAMAPLLSILLAIVILGLVLSVVSIISMVFTYMSYYDLYMSTNPSNAVVFLVLGIVAGFLNNIFVFINKDKDEGMRPPEIPCWENPVPPV